MWRNAFARPISDNYSFFPLVMASSPALEPPVIANPSGIRIEKWIILALLVIVLVLKLCYIKALPYSSDEPQHLHVAWGWTQGMVQYRDYFDNHTPVFHLVMAPLVYWLGERADILVWMRVAMLPLFGIALACLYWLGTRLYSRRAAIWATLLCAASPAFLITTTEFRADVLWMTAWVFTITVAFGGTFTRKRAALTGLLLGLTFGVSMKTTLLLAGLLGSLAIVAGCLPAPERKRLFADSLCKGLLALSGFCVVPLAIIGFFASRGALDSLYYCVIQHNTLPGKAGGVGKELLFHCVLFVVELGVLVAVGRKLLQYGADRTLAVRRTLIFLSGAFFLVLLYCFWPLVTRQDYPPVAPLLALTIAPLLLRVGAFPGSARHFCIPLMLLVVLTEINLAIAKRSPLRFRAQQSELLTEVLRLTEPTDFVMDAKGETVFRHRPFYYVLETLTEERMRRGLIADTIAEDMAEKGTCVTLLQKLTGKSKDWVDRFYIPVTERMSVVGQMLPEQKEPVARHFEIGVSARYVVWSATGPVSGTMDGAPCSGPVTLTPGKHTFESNDPRPLAVFWAQAAERGFSPFVTLPAKRPSHK